MIPLRPVEYHPWAFLGVSKRPGYFLTVSFSIYNTKCKEKVERKKVAKKATQVPGTGIEPAPHLTNLQPII